MRFTVRTVYDFGADRELVGDDLLNATAWDALRTDTLGPFALARDRETWEAAALGNPDLATRAREINRLLDEAGVESVASYGVGAGALEYLLWRERPDRQLTVTDFGPATVARLTAVFPEVVARRHDLLEDHPLDADVHLFHRVDTELTNEQWRALLRRFSDQRLLVVAADVLRPADVAFQLLNRIRSRDATHTGWARNRAAFESLWNATHRGRALQVGDLTGWALEPLVRGSSVPF